MAETEEELAVRFGAVIRGERKRRRWSQAVFAERADVSLDYVGMLERGERLPSFPVAIRIAGLFDTTLAAMLAPPDAAPGTGEPAEPWLDEATAILRSLPPQALAIALGMLRAASVTSGATADTPKRPGGRKPRG